MHQIAPRRRPHPQPQGVTVDLAAGELVCLTGVSGAGKSSLALDTLYAEGQRRFVESFSPYARQFLERLERPPMDALEPVAAGVAVDRRAPVKSSRSTVATLADVEPYLSALFTREAMPVCPELRRGGGADAIRDVRRARASPRSTPGAAAIVTYPVRVAGTAEFLDVREPLLKDGYRRLLVQGEVRELEALRPSEATDAAGQAEVVVDRVKLSSGRREAASRASAMEEAWARRGSGDAHLVARRAASAAVRQGLVCPKCARELRAGAAGALQLPVPGGRVRRVPRLRAHHRHRLGQGHPRPRR